MTRIIMPVPGVYEVRYGPAAQMTPDVREQVDAIPAEKRVCNWCAQTTPAGDPWGPVCGVTATHVLEWTWQHGGPGSRRWSFACDQHHGPPGIDPSGTHGWHYTAFEL